MSRTVVAFSNDKLRETILEALEKNGIPVHAICRTGSEALRSIKKTGGGVLVCAPRLSDMTADDLADDLGEDAFYLVAGKPMDLDMVENENIFKITLPASSGMIAGSARILVELDERRRIEMRPERPAEEKELINKAKLIVMERNDMTEDQAYRFLQKRSMESSTPLVEVARMFLDVLTVE